MKKILSLLLIVTMLLALCACGEKEGKEGGGKLDNNDDANLVKIGDYEAIYKGSEIVKDSEGNDAIIISFDFTNKGKEAQSFEWAYYYSVFQEGIGLDYAVIWVSEDSYDTLDESMRTEVQPGKTVEVQMTYKLRSLTAPVELEFTDLLDKEKDTLSIDLSTAKWNNTEVDPTEDPATETPTEDPTTEAPATEDPTTEAPAVDADWWLGDWYGTWMIVNGTGEYADLVDGIWDCCAFINPTGDGRYLLSIWDEDYNDYNSNCLAECYLELRTEFAYGERGAMQSTDDEANFFWTAPLTADSWYIDPALLDYNDTFTIYCDLVDENGDTCEYMLTLCKWGSEWDDNAGARPYYYDSYFMPLMQEGAELPTVFTPEATD